jgi:integrase
MIDRYIEVVLPTKPKQIKDQTHQLRWWRSEIGDYSLADVTPVLIVQCRDELGKTRAAATVVRYMAALSHAYTIAVNEWGWVTDSPTRKVKKPKEARGRVRFLDDDERHRLMNACAKSSNQYLHTCVILALSTGMRQGELMALKWSDVSLKKSFIILHETKNGERRRVPLAGYARELLIKHSKVRRLATGLLFPSKNAAKPVDLRKPFGNALKEAGITDFRWHDLRHCTASYLAMNGASLAEIAEVLGHKTLQMVKRYAHLSDGHVSSVVESMNNNIFGQEF